MAFVDATLHRTSGSVDFGSFSRFGLGEHGQQDDASSGGDVVADAGALPAEVEAQLAELPVELASERFAQKYALIGGRSM